MNRFFFIFLTIFCMNSFGSPAFGSLPEGEPQASGAPAPRVLDAHLTAAHFADNTPLLGVGAAGLATDIPGAEDDWLRFTMCCCRVTSNTAHGFVGLASLGAAFLSGLAALSGATSEETKQKLTLAAGILNLVGVGFTAFSAWAGKERDDRERDLRQLLADNAIRIPPKTPSTISPQPHA